MNIILSDIMTVFSVISLIITIGILWNTVAKTREMKNTSKQLELEKNQSTSEYDDILQVTHKLESEREKNKGEHFDESVYLQRANMIRENSRFFSWIK
ncbi:MAG: hypothetical protein K2H96_04480 [Muribaculaceae bacterium]|nr:hypothetical protein [Muribaculaceae bacterium]